MRRREEKRREREGGRGEKERKRESERRTWATHHDRQHGVDLLDVVLALVEDVDGDARLLAAQAAHAARLQGLHTALSRPRRRTTRCSTTRSALARRDVAYARASARFMRLVLHCSVASAPSCPYVPARVPAPCSLLPALPVRALPAGISKSP